MMFPHTRRLADMMAQEEDPEDFNGFSPEAALHEDPRVLQLKMKRRYQTGMLKKMLEEAGYGDLAKMTTLSKREYEDYNE